MNRRNDVSVEASEIHDLIRAGDFQKIYEKTSVRIKGCYSPDSFSEKMGLLVQNLKVGDPLLRFREDEDATEKIATVEYLLGPSDTLIEGIYTVGAEGNPLREWLFFKKEDGKLSLDLYRVFDMSEKDPNVRSSMIACGAG